MSLCTLKKPGLTNLFMALNGALYYVIISRGQVSDINDGRRMMNAL